MSSDSPAPQSNLAFPTTDHPIIVTAHSPRFNNKLFFAGAGLLVLILGIVTSVFLLTQRQQLQTQAWDCEKYDFNVSITGLVTVINNSNRTEPPQKVSISINNNPVGIFDVPELAPEQSTTIAQIEVPTTAGFSWSATGSEDCSDSGVYPPVEPSITPTRVPDPSVTPIPSPTVAPTCVPRPACLDLTPPCEPVDIGYCPATPTPIPSVTPTPNPSVTPNPSSTPNPTPTSVPGPSSTPGPTGVPDPTATPIVPHVTSIPTPTPVTSLPQSGAIETTWILSALGIILIGAGLLLAL